MINSTLRKLVSACAISTALLGLSGCKKLRRTTSAPKSDAFADQIKSTVAQPSIKVMHWPNYADYQPLVQKFYDDRNYEVAWVTDDGQPTAQARAFIEAFQHADRKGLKPEDYDGSLWSDRLSKLPAKDGDATATFDAAMTVSAMRYISDLHIGRVNPTHFNFDIDVQQKKYDLPTFLSDNAVDATDVPKLIRSVEPDSEQYRELEAALVKYEGLAAAEGRSGAQPLPEVSKPIEPGSPYADALGLQARLQLEGDLAGGPDLAASPIPKHSAHHGSDAGAGHRTTVQKDTAKVKQGAEAVKNKAIAAYDKAAGKPVSPPAEADSTQAAVTPAPAPGDTEPAPAPVEAASGSGAYTPALAGAVKHYQERHGLTPDGKLTPATVASLNVPLSARVGQLADTLERWRWLPNEYVNPTLMVNLPEFMLRGYGDDHQQQFKMRVVVGQVLGQHQTPVFTHEMKYLIFRPFWNVPQSIIKKELTKHIEASGIGYLSRKNFETVNAQGQHVEATAAQVEHGGVVVREKPGPTNSLGLVKFMFPNQYDIYLHSTDARQLFSRSVRDFSHGCVRVQYPDQLAAWVLKTSGTPGDWDLPKVQDAMNNGPDSHQINLSKPLPIVIFYQTARVAEDGSVDFFDDIYGYDKQLDQVLAQGMPYPSQQQKVNGNQQGGDTT